MFKWWTKISLPNRILIFIVIGIVLGLILAGDRICDMPRTMNNNIGNAMVTFLSAKRFKMVDPESPIIRP